MTHDDRLNLAFLALAGVSHKTLAYYYRLSYTQLRRILKEMGVHQKTPALTLLDELTHAIPDQRKQETLHEYSSWFKNTTTNPL